MNESEDPRSGSQDLQYVTVYTSTRPDSFGMKHLGRSKAETDERKTRSEVRPRICL